MSANVQVTEETIRDALRSVKDPIFDQNIVELDLVKDVQVRGNAASVTIQLLSPGHPHQDRIEREARERLEAVEGLTNVDVTMAWTVNSRKLEHQELLPGVKNVVAVASGKGGVGKSTTACNLALALSQTGAKTGLMDADIYGPSIPLMFGLEGQPEARNGKIVPMEKLGLKLMSMGLLANERTPVIWRGPMVHGVVKQFMSDVTWGDLDYLVVDLPPGTGDAQLTLTQNAPLAGAVIVTTPQDVALIDARKGLLMFKQVNVPVLGIVENMSYFICPHCNGRSEIFAHGGGERTAHELSTAFLGAIPIEAQIRADGDSGMPVVGAHPESSVAEAYRHLAGNIAALLSKMNYQQQAFTIVN